jgi:hypothetical protein
VAGFSSPNPSKLATALPARGGEADSSEARISGVVAFANEILADDFKHGFVWIPHFVLGLRP